MHQTEGGYGVQLDCRHLRTPLRKVFAVPTEPLALAVAQEWNCQGSFVQPTLMHLTALCNTVLDDHHRREREEAASELLQYLSTDTLCFRAPEPPELVALQRREWDPIVSWFNDRYCLQLEPGTGLLPPVLPPETLRTLQQYLMGLNKWAFMAFHHSVESCKSVVLSCALFEDRVGADTACDLALLESRHQTSRWGRVEWLHDVEAQDLRARLAAGLLLARLSDTAVVDHLS